MDKDFALDRLINYFNSYQTSNNFDLNLSKTHIINLSNHDCLVRELTWKEGLDIDSKSFLQNEKGIIFNSENEKREILKLALISINDQNNQKIDFEFSNLSFTFVENLWSEYQKYLHLSTDEINFIFNSTKKYFNSSNRDFFPVHPMILEVDYMLKGIVSYSRDEFQNLSMREFETIQLILATINEKSNL